MEWIGFEDKNNPNDWRVEANDYENEGAVYVAIFSGPDAKERAKEYAGIKNAQEVRISQIMKLEQLNANGQVGHFW